MPTDCILLSGILSTGEPESWYLLQTRYGVPGIAIRAGADILSVPLYGVSFAGRTLLADEYNPAQVRAVKAIQPLLVIIREPERSIKAIATRGDYDVFPRSLMVLSL